MDISTTTCALSNPVDAFGNTPASSTPFAFASSTCVTSIDPASTTSAPILEWHYTAGDILVAFLLLCGLMVLFWGLIRDSIL